jgi:hypothetical protein
MQDAVEFETVTLEEWEKVPPPAPPKPKDKFEHVLTSVRDGNIAKIELKEEKDLKGTRIGLARKSRNLGFLVEFRNVGNTLYVKRSDKPLENLEEKASSKKKADVS